MKTKGWRMELKRLWTRGDITKGQAITNCSFTVWGLLTIGLSLMVLQRTINYKVLRARWLTKGGLSYSAALFPGFVVVVFLQIADNNSFGG